MRTRTLVVILLFVAPLATAAAPSTDRTLLFVDDHDVLYRAGTTRVLHPPTRHAANPLITRDKPWEVQVAYASVYRNPKTGKYQMWYQAWNGKPIKSPLSCVVAYAESDDGIKWVKPELDLFPFDDVKRTNIVLVANGNTSYRYANAVLVDERDPDPARRYKMGYTDWSPVGKQDYVGLHVAFSPDGIHWTKFPHDGPVQRVAYGDYNPKLPFSDQTDRPLSTSLTMSDAVDICWDPKRDVFAWYGKMWIDGPDGRMFWKHAIGRTESKDFVNWSKPQLVASPDDKDPPYTEFHTSPVFFYNDEYFCQSQVLNRGVGGGVIDVELMLSRDGIAWQRPFRDHWFLPRSKSGFDSGSLFTNSTPVVLDDELRFYYGGYTSGATDGTDDFRNPSGVGLATLPRDRFAGITPAENVGQGALDSAPAKNVGQVTLKPIDLAGVATLSLNADASTGEIRVELLSEDGLLVRGFTRDDAVPIKTDSLRHEVKWNGGKTLASLPPGKYMPRIHLNHATVYAMTLMSSVRPK